MTPLDVEDASAVLRAGGLVVIPTDTVYGVAVRADDAGAVERLFQVKGRSRDVPIAVLVDDIGQADRLVVVDDRARELAGRHWPGPLTIVLARRPAAPVHLGTESGIGVRAPDHDVARALCRAVGPLATTSANLHGEPPIATATEAARVFGVGYVDGGVINGSASTVIDACGSRLEVLRPGPIAFSPDEL